MKFRCAKCHKEKGDELTVPYIGDDGLYCSTCFRTERPDFNLAYELDEQVRLREEREYAEFRERLHAARVEELQKSAPVALTTEAPRMYRGKSDLDKQFLN